MLLKPFYPYIAGGLLLVLVGTHVWAYGEGKQSGAEAGRKEVAEQIRSQYEAELAASRAEAALAKKLNLSLQEKLSNIPPSQTIREIIRANPTDCPVPGPVTDSLREQATRANALRSPR